MQKLQDPHQSNNLLLLQFFVSWHVMQRLIATDYKHLNFFIQNTCIQRSDETFRNRSFLCGTGYLCIRWLRIKTGAHIFFTPICIWLSSNNYKWQNRVQLIHMLKLPSMFTSGVCNLYNIYATCWKNAAAVTPNNPHLSWLLAFPGILPLSSY